MKLVDILARELNEWPKGAVCITQDRSAEIWPCNNNSDLARDGNHWTATLGFKIGRDIVPGAELAEDWKTAIITREIWQAERSKMKQGDKVTVSGLRTTPKANKDGWIRHRGGKCPVDADSQVEYRMRDGGILNSRAGRLEWGHYDECGDIMAWRPHLAEKPSKVELKAITPERIEAIQARPKPTIADKPKACPLQWRDRIKEIDATTDALATERADLISKLAAEGFALIEPVQVDADMSDWRNLEDGDLVSTGRDPGGYSSLSNGVHNIEIDQYDDDCPIAVDGLWFTRSEVERDLKWHSRPKK
jgi:hypothetical protein